MVLRTHHTVDNSDWLKTTAIILVVVDHIGYFFIEDEGWWSVFGRLAAPSFFFLLGYAQTRTVPLHWLWLGVFLTLLDSWNTDWTWVAPNILFSLAFIRIVRPYVKNFMLDHGWMRLGPRRNRHRLRDKTPTPRTKAAKWSRENENSICSCQT